MSEQTSMEDILAVNNPDVAPDKKADEKPEPKAEAEAPEPTETADSTDAGETETKDAEADKVEDKKPDTVPHAALHEEREKHKQTRGQFEELKAQNAQLLQLLSKGQDTAKPPATEEAGVSFSEDPERFITSQLEKISEAGRREAAIRHFDMSEASARRRHGNEQFQAAFDWFQGAAKEEPALIDKLNQQPDPAEWIMTTYSKAGEVAKVSDPAYWAEREKELRAQWEAEQAKAAEEAAEEAAKTVPQPRKSLAKARGANSGRTGKAQFTGPTPIDDILSNDR